MAEGTIKIKLVRSPICTPEKHKVDRASARTEEDQPGCGAAGYAGVSRHGEEDSAPAGIGGLGVDNDHDESEHLKPPAGQKHEEAAHRPRYGLRPGQVPPAAATRAQQSISGYSIDARIRGRPDAAAPPSAEARLHQYLQEGIRDREPRSAWRSSKAIPSIPAQPDRTGRDQEAGRRAEGPGHGRD